METPQSLSVLHMVGVTKTFPGIRALSAANLTIRAGEVHGLVGENGAGKSTIIKVLAGVYHPDTFDELTVDGTAIETVTPAVMYSRGLRFVHQELHLVPHFTVAESVFMGHELTGLRGLRKREMNTRAAEILRERLGLELNPKALVRDIGPAQKKLVQVARALIDDDVRLIVLDEPTAPLAAREVEQVLGAVRRLRDQGIAVLYVSHYLGEVAGLCDRVTVFRDGKDVGVIESVHSTSTQQMIEMMTGREAGAMFPARQEPVETTVLEADSLSDGLRYRDVSFRVRHGEVFGIAGLLGSGREELIDSLVGLRKAKHGKLRLRGKNIAPRSPSVALRQGMVLIPRDRRHDGLILSSSVRVNINFSTLDKACRAGVFISASKLAARAGEMVSKLDIRVPDTARKVRLLSGGNQQKVVIARALLAETPVLILDEPTVGVDVGAKAEIYALVAQIIAEGRSVVISSNDPAELAGLCNRIAVLVRGQITRIYEGDAVDSDELVRAMTGSTLQTAGDHGDN